ncbi:MAG TPA: cytochrome ubiquinol oxidase subunit I [Trueperaceae bacterium]|nr:cytochrome ubiquinol oxidase subunit I [Trueperaceae bacterium]
MDPLLLARWQFGVTTSYHYVFVPLTIGLGLIVAIMQSFHYRTQNPMFDRMARFWGKLFVINFALGVVTGIVQEFQFGMNWSEYSRFVGDIFGIPLAIEALMAFFLESTFLGLWLFGRDKLPKAVHLLSIWLVALGSLVSAIWILMANAWMQQPVGYSVINGRARLSDPVAVFLNERLLVEAPHTVLAALTTGGLFVLGISAWHLIRHHDRELFARSAQIALVIVAVAGLLTATSGHAQAQHTARTQPMKLAAMEALWDSEQPAAFSLWANIDQNNGTSTREIKLPYLLSVLAYNNTTSEVKGIHELQAQDVAAYGPGDYVPPVAVVYWTFRAMVGLGILFILLALTGLALWWRGRLERRWFLRLAMVFVFLPYLANFAGWITTEMGRQPWVVQGLLRTASAVSPNVGGAQVLVTFLGFTLLYGVLAFLDFFLLYRFARPVSDVRHGEQDTGLGDVFAY